MQCEQLGLASTLVLLCHRDYLDLSLSSKDLNRANDIDGISSNSLSLRRLMQAYSRSR